MGQGRTLNLCKTEIINMNCSITYIQKVVKNNNERKIKLCYTACTFW